MSTFKTPIASRHYKKYNSKWEHDAFRDNGIRLWLFVDLASVSDREISTAVLERAMDGNKERPHTKQEFRDF